MWSLLVGIFLGTLTVMGLGLSVWNLQRSSLENLSSSQKRKHAFLGVAFFLGQFAAVLAGVWVSKKYELDSLLLGGGALGGIFISALFMHFVVSAASADNPKK